MSDLFEPLERQFLQLAPGHWRRETADEMSTRIGDALRAAMHEVKKHPTWWRVASSRREWWRR